MQFFEELRKGMLFRAVVMIVAGLVLIFYPGMTQNTIAYIIAIVLVINGIINIVGYFKTSRSEEGLNTYSSPAGLIIGILCIVFAGLISKVLMSIIPIILGIIITVNGIFKLMEALDAKKTAEQGWVLYFVIACITLAVGVLSLMNPFGTGNMILRIIGIGLLFGGITDMLVYRRHM